MKQSLIRGKMSHSSKSGQARGLGAGEGEGALVPQFFAEQLTLSLTGGQIMPTIVLQAPLPPGFSDLATTLEVICNYDQNSQRICEVKRWFSVDMWFYMSIS